MIAASRRAAVSAFLCCFVGLGAVHAGNEPNDVIDPNAPAVITDGGCFTTVATIGEPLDVDFYRVAVTAVPAEGLQLAAYADGEAGTTGNPLLRVFKEDGTDLANNDSDGRPFDEDVHPDTDPRGEAHCPPRPGINALVSVHVTAAGNYYVAVSGGGCDAWDDANCIPDLTGRCNDRYDPFIAGSGTPGQSGPYNLTIGLGSLAPLGTEPNDSIPLARTLLNVGQPGRFEAVITGYLGDGPFGDCLGDFDYWRIPGTDLTPGNALDIEVVSDFVGHDTSSFMMVYEKLGAQPHTPVAANDNSLGSRDSRCLVPVRAGADYYVMVMPVGYPPQDIDRCFRQFGGMSEYEPGLNQQVPGAGDAIPGALGQPSFEGPYELRVTEIPLPPATGPFEPNDSLAEASANTRIEVVNNTLTPVSVDAYLGDGRYGWSIGGGGLLGDTDLFELTGLVPGGVVEAVVKETAPYRIAEMYIAFFAGNRLHDFTDLILLLLGMEEWSALVLSSVPETGPYYVLVAPSDDRILLNIGNYLPWDVTIPGTLLSGQFSGPYTLSVTARTPPPQVSERDVLFGASRSDRDNEILWLDPNTGLELRSIPAPALVNGAATGLAINPTRSILYYMNGPDIGGTGNIMWELDPESGAVLHSTNLTLDPFIRQTSGGTQNIDGSLDGLGWAGEHLWMCLQNVARVYRWNPATRLADLTFTASSMGLTSFREGLDGTDDSNLGTGHIIYVSARNTRVIAVIDVGSAGNGPTNNGVMQLLGTIPSPTYAGGPGISNDGGVAVLRTISGTPTLNLYVPNINATLLHVVDADPAAQGAIVGGWIYPDFGCSGLTGWSPLPGDLDLDGDVDLADFVLFQLCFAGSSSPPAAICPPGVDADLDGDGDVDLTDFLIFQQNFTGSF